MPAIADRMVTDDQMSHVTMPQPVSKMQKPVITSPAEKVSGFTRCPIPPIFASNPDSLRQWNQGGRLPQYRIYSQALRGNS